MDDRYNNITSCSKVTCKKIAAFFAGPYLSLARFKSHHYHESVDNFGNVKLCCWSINSSTKVTKALQTKMKSNKVWGVNAYKRQIK
ncbi:hypothetical protein QTP88_017990 [Uroleucon formosanum]